MGGCVLCYSVFVPITAAVCVGFKSEHQVFASGIEHINADRCLSYDIIEHLWAEASVFNIEAVGQ